MKKTREIKRWAPLFEEDAVKDFGSIISLRGLTLSQKEAKQKTLNGNSPYALIKLTILDLNESLEEILK